MQNQTAALLDCSLTIMMQHCRHTPLAQRAVYRRQEAQGSHRLSSPKTSSVVGGQIRFLLIGYQATKTVQKWFNDV